MPWSSVASTVRSESGARPHVRDLQRCIEIWLMCLTVQSSVPCSGFGHSTCHASCMHWGQSMPALFLRRLIACCVCRPDA